MPGLSNRKKQLIRTFHFEARRLLSDSERRALFRALKEFQKNRQVDIFVTELRDLLHSPEKLDLLRHIRDLIPRSHVSEFDGYFRQTARLGASFSPTMQQRRPTGHHSPEMITVPRTHERVFDSMPQGEVMVVNIQKISPDSNLGFSVRGGAEHGLGIYVSEIERGSLAEMSGLEIGDKLLEVNNISLEEVTSSGTVKVLTGSNKLKLLVERTGQLPEWRLSREKVTWYDSHTKLLMTGDYTDGGSSFIRGLDTNFPERRVTLSCSDRHKELGFNIRGGSEYGIGIYVSRVDKGSIAQRHGVRVGDQILEVNGIPFDSISHPNAVDVLRRETHLILTLRDMGRFPAYKELYAEYSWNNHGTMSSSLRNDRTKVKQTKLRDMCLDKGSQRNRELHLRVPIQSGIYSGHEESNELPLQSEIYLPHVQRGDSTSKSNSWTYGSIQIENWPGLKRSGAEGSMVEGSVNPAYLPDDSDTLSVGSESDTDDSSGIHGEYDITMDDIIARGDDLEEVKIDMGDNSGISGSVELVDLKPQCMDSLSELDSDDSDSIHDNAVVIFNNTVEHTSDTNSLYGNRDYYDGNEDRMEQSEVILVNHELSPLQNSMDIDSVSSSMSNEPNMEIENVTVNYAVSDSSSYTATKVEQRRRKSVTYMEPPHLQQTESDEESEQGKTNGEGLDEEEQHDITNPYQMNLEDDEDLMCVMQNFDDQIRDLEQRQSSLGVIEMSTLSTDPTDHDQSTLHPDNSLDVPGRKEDSIISSKWKAIKEKLKGSLRVKAQKTTLEKDMEKSDTWDPRGGYYGSMKLHKNSINKQNMAVLREESKKLLSADEYVAILRHVENYHNTRDLDHMVEVILPILDKPEKMLLLRDVRGVLYAADLIRFDHKVNQLEVDAYEKLSTKLHLQLNHVNKGKKPKKHLLVTETDPRLLEQPTKHRTDESGHFYIKPVEQQQHEQRVKQQVIDIMAGHAPTPLGSETGSDLTPSGNSMDMTDNLPKRQVVTHIPKDKSTLGLCVSGGSNSKKQPEVRVDEVLEGGAASDADLIQPGMVIISVDGQSLVGVTHKEAVTILKTAFNDRSKSAMEICLQHN